MGLVFAEVGFDGQAPALSDIADKVTELSGLPVTVAENEPAGNQAVYLRGYMGQEPTLLLVTILALEDLGGRPRHPIGEVERRQYGTPITPAQLEERRRKLARQLWPIVVVSVLLLPLAIPLWLVGFVLMMPWRVWKANKLYRRYSG
jgi:hypothetical protein